MSRFIASFRHSFGEDDRPLNFCHQRKSVSAEVNYGIRFENYIQAENFLKTLCNEVENRLKSIRSEGKSITVKLMVSYFKGKLIDKFITFTG